MSVGMYPDQFGFRKGKSTEDAINRTIQLVEEATEKYVIGIFVDISGAFDNLWWPALFGRLRDIKCPANLYNIFRNYCMERTVSMVCPGEKITKTTTKGCPQGSVCGPVFWDVAVEACLHQMHDMEEVIEVVAYADDIVILIGGNSRNDLERKSNYAVNELNKWCHENKLKLSAEKNMYMVLKGKLTRNPIIKMEENKIKRTRCIKYLGIMLDECLNFQQHLKYTCEKTKRVMHKIISIGQRRFQLPLKVIKTYHNAILVAITSYGSSVWAHRLHRLDNSAVVDRMQRNILIRLSGAYRTTAKDALLVTLGIIPLHLLVLERAAIYWLKKGNQDRAEQILRSPAENRQGIRNTILNKWQEDWDLSLTGRRTHGFFPDVRERLRLRHFQPKRGMVHYITGHGPYNETLHRLGIRNSPECTCTEAQGTPEHVMWECRDTRNICPNIRIILANRQLFQVVRIEPLYEACEKLANSISKFFKELYIGSLRATNTRN